MLRDKPTTDYETLLRNRVASSDALIMTHAEETPTYNLYAIEKDSTGSPLFFALTDNPEHQMGERIRRYGALNPQASVGQFKITPYKDSDGNLRTEERSTSNAEDPQSIITAFNRVLETLLGTTHDPVPADIMNEVHLVGDAYFYLPSQLVNGPSETAKDEDKMYTGLVDGEYKGFPSHGEVWEGYRVRLEFEDWRDRANTLALETDLSDKQAVVWAVLEHVTHAKEVAHILDRSEPTISQQVRNAATKIIRAQNLLGIESENAETSSAVANALRRAQNRESKRVTAERYRMNATQLSEPKTYRCPECGCDSGNYTKNISPPRQDMDPTTPWKHNLNTEAFEKESPPLFYTSRISSGISYNNAIVCPDCTHVADASVFGDEWLKEHRDWNPSEAPI